MEEYTQGMGGGGGGGGKSPASSASSSSNVQFGSPGAPGEINPTIAIIIGAGMIGLFAIALVVALVIPRKSKE